MRLSLCFCAVLLLFCAVGMPASSSAQTGPLVLPGVPLLRQQHSLTCESSAVSMATRGQLVESQLMAVMPRNSNPNLGFRGSPDGFQGTKLVDYGVYAQPLAAALLKYGYTGVPLTYASDGDIKSYINRGWPVVAWVTYSLLKASPRLVQHNGVSFVLVPHEHAVTVVGYDNATVLANDPWTGRQVRYFWRDFNRSWGLFGNMALAVQPCQAAQPVARITVAALSSSSVTWEWPRATGAAHYLVTVTRYAAKARVEFSGTQDTLQFTLTSPTPGKLYSIDVRSMSACGGLTIPATLWVRAPDATPTPVEGTVGPTTLTPTPTTTSTPVPTTVPLPSATATP